MNLQQAYFKCAYECFDRSRKQDEISNCVEHCSVPVVKSQQHFENEMAQFQVKEKFPAIKDYTRNVLDAYMMKMIADIFG